MKSRGLIVFWGFFCYFNITSVQFQIINKKITAELMYFESSWGFKIYSNYIGFRIIEVLFRPNFEKNKRDVSSRCRVLYRLSNIYKFFLLETFISFFITILLKFFKKILKIVSFCPIFFDLLCLRLSEVRDLDPNLLRTVLIYAGFSLPRQLHFVMMVIMVRWEPHPRHCCHVHRF